MTYRRSIFSSSRAVALLIGLLSCSCYYAHAKSYFLGLNPEYHAYTKKAHGTIFIEQIDGVYESSGPGYWHLYPPPPAYTGWKGQTKRMVGITEYLKAECRLAGLEVLEEEPGDESVVIGWCGLRRNTVSEYEGGRHFIRFYSRKTVTQMDVEWICGLRERKRAIWERSYFGKGAAELDILLLSQATTQMKHKAYTQAVEQIVKAYVDDLVLYFNQADVEE